MRRRRGFTIIEVMAVITIIGLLGTAVTLAVHQHVINARADTARSNLGVLRAAVDMLRMDTGRLPDRLEDLWVRPSTARGWKGPYVQLTDGLPAPDPWGNAFVYERRGGTSFELRALGADGAPGGEGPDADVTLVAGP